MKKIKLNEEELTEIIKRVVQKTFEEQCFDMCGENGTWEKIGELINEQKKLYEGLIKTYSVHDTERILNDNFPNIRYIVRTNDNNQTNYFQITVYKNTDIDKLIQIMNTYGWYLAIPRIEKLKTITNALNQQESLILKFEAKFDTEMTDEIAFDESHLKQFIHITQYSNLNNIINKGLCPKTNSRDSYHPERIYLIPITTPINGIINLITQFFYTIKGKINGKNNIDQNIREKNIEKYAVLEVDLGRITETEYGTSKPKTRLFKDPNLNGGFYTMENIRPENIILKYIITLNSWGGLVDTAEVNQKLK